MTFHSQGFDPDILLGAFAAVALMLASASVGIYGVISYWMAQRVREIGIRMALGAQPREIVRMALGEGVRLGGAGAVIGVAAVFVIAPTLSSFSTPLFGVRPIDPLTLGAVTIVTRSPAPQPCPTSRQKSWMRRNFFGAVRNS